VEEQVPCFIGVGDGLSVLSPPHFIKCGGSFGRDCIHIL
jgi:hypothetical protein